MTLENRNTVQKAYINEVLHGWLIPLLRHAIFKIKGASVIPLRMEEQYTINEKGERTIKCQDTHDCTFPFPSGDSINNRTIQDLLEPCIYGQCLQRMLHQTHRLRLNYPHEVILQMKHDLDAAYRRMHKVLDEALLSITIVDGVAYLEVHLPFGVATGPSKFSTMSEMVFDATNDLMADKTWDPKSLHSLLRRAFDSPVIEDMTFPFAVAKPLHNPIPNRDVFCDGYIDDIISVAVHLKDNVERAQNAAPLIVHAMFRPIDTLDKLTRDDPVSLRKLFGEGTPCEQKTNLGWLVDTRSFRVYLPMEKTAD